METKQPTKKKMSIKKEKGCVCHFLSHFIVPVAQFKLVQPFDNGAGHLHDVG